MNKVLSIVVLSHNRKECLVDNIKKLCKQVEGNSNVEIIIVDNNSTDGSKKVLSRLENEYENVEIVFNKKNLGVAGGRNKGYEKCTGEYVVSIDDDTIITFEQLNELVDIFAEFSKAGILAPKVMHHKTRHYQFYHGEEPIKVGNFHGSCRIYRSEIFKDVGYLDEDCTFGGEELDFSIRCRNEGYEIIYIPCITAIHNNYIREGDIGKERRRLRVYNFIRIHHKHFGLRNAFLFNIRYFASHFYSGFKKYGLIFAFSLVYPALLGILKGRKNHKEVSTNVQKFYKNKRVEPDFGNKPIFDKVIWKFKTEKSGSE